MTRPRRTRVKFCGMTSPADVALAVQAGADAVGVIVAPSPRSVRLDDLAAIAASIPPLVNRVGVLVNQGRAEADALRAHGFTLQFSGDESPQECESRANGEPYVKVFHVDPAAPAIDLDACAAYQNALWMFDARVPGLRGGTGARFDWSVVAAAAADHRIIVSGGLTPENVAECVRSVRPYAVDVRSGVETDDRKDPAKMLAFEQAVAEADANP